MGMEATGIVYKVGETQQVSDRFSKREIIIELADNPKYPQHVKFQCTGDRCAQLDGIKKNDSVRIEFSLRGRIFQNKKTGEDDCFTNLDVWKIERVGQQHATHPGGGGTAPAPSVPPVGSDGPPPLSEDDIPF